MIALNPNQNTTIQFHQILQDKLFLKNLQSCNTKDELNYYVKPKEKLIALHDKFIKYGTKRATNFLIIDVDHNNQTLEDYSKEIKYKLGGTEPSWICKTNKGFHIGFILDKPLWMNNLNDVKIAQAIKRDLTLLFDADIAGSHRLIGYWRNPLTHSSKLSLKSFSIDELQEISTKQYFDSFSLFDDKKLNEIKSQNRTKDKIQIAKSNWEKIDKTGFTQGNRNNFLFNKIIGMLYNGIISNDEVLKTLNTINNNTLENNEINKIAKSIMKYNIKPITSTLIMKRKIRGIYSNDLYKNNIHNYKNNNKIVFARQQIGQKISTAKIIQKTINKLIKGYTKTYINHESFTNDTLVANSNIQKRTIQRYRNERELEKSIKAKAFKEYLKSIAPQGVMADGTPIKDIINIAINSIDFYYLKTNTLFKFKLDDDSRLIFYKNSPNIEENCA